MTMTLRCTHCDQTMSIAPRKPGSRVECPVCGKSVTVPGAETKPVRPAARNPETPVAVGVVDTTAPQMKSVRTIAAPPVVDARSHAPISPDRKTATLETVVNPVSRFPAAQTEAFAELPRPAAPRPPSQWVEREPWFYAVVARYAKILLWLNVVLFSLFFLGALGATVFAIQEGMPLAQAAGIVFAIVVWFLLIFLSGILLPAALLLLVDMGRNVRAVRKTLGQ